MSEKSQMPLKVTYIIGNGFDLALGLHTRYKDFIPYFVKYLHKLVRDSSSYRAMARWLVDKIKNNIYEFWNDAELGFGQLKFSECKMKRGMGNDVCKLVSFCHEQFQHAMYDWMTGEMSKFHVPVDQRQPIRELFAKRLICGCLEGGIDVGSQDLCLRTAEEKGVEMRIISFNYTNTIEQIIGDDMMPLDLVISDYGRREYRVGVRFSKVAFVHGKLNNERKYRRLVFGVDNEKQIEDPKVCEYDECLARMRKSSYKAFFRDPDRKLNTAMDWLRTSDVIVLFGHSLGITDLHWWQTIYDCVRTKRCYLVQFNHYSENDAKMYNDDEIVYKQAFLRKMFGGLGQEKVNSAFKDKFVKKIHIVPPAKVKSPNGQSLLGDYLNLNYVGQLCVQHL